MEATPTKRICINYACPPLWNAALNFLFWTTFGVTSVILAYLFFMYVMDTTIKADSTNPSVNIGDPNKYDNLVQKHLGAIPFIGKFLYP